MNTSLLLSEGMKMFLRRQKLRYFEIKKYKGNAEEICKQIINDCFNGDYFQTSAGHFNVFYMRDFGICCEALLKLGYNAEIKKTLQYALNIYRQDNKITTTITKSGKTIDMFYYSPDSLAFLLYCLHISQLKDLIEMYKPFLDQQILLFFNTAINKNTGLINDELYSSMKDHSKIKSSCYNNCMAGMIKKEIELIEKNYKINLQNPFKMFDYKRILFNKFFNGSYFNDGLYDKNYVSGDANVFPFWCRIFDIEKDSKAKQIFSSCLAAIQKEGLDKPFPLKYTNTQLKGKYLFFQNFLAPNYEGNSIWLHLGLCYLDLIAVYSKNEKKSKEKDNKEKNNEELLRKYLRLYQEKILESQNFLEIYNTNGTVYKTVLYHSDEGMLWASKYLENFTILRNSHD